MKDLIIRHATRPGGGTVDIAITEGRAEVAPSVAGPARREIDATGLHVFPGFIDAHVHFNEPGREHWEGLETGPAALAVGGGTCFADMPLNSDPPVLDAETFARKRRVAEQKSVLDFALWGGLCPGHTDRIDEMAGAGAMGFKAFLCPSGIEEFTAADPATLREGLLRARRWNLPVAVHAELPAVLERHAATTDRTLRGFSASRPKEAEVAAIRMACEIAGETGGKLHVVHVSCAEGLEAIAAARRAGADVTAETCPHYLLFDEFTAEKIGARAKCAPPLRQPADVEALWQGLLAGLVDTVGSDHSPAPPGMKTGDDFFAIWGGIAGCQHAFPAFVGELHSRSPGSLPLASALLHQNVAARFRLPAASLASFTLLDLTPGDPVAGGRLLYRHPVSLYENYRPKSRVHSVIRRGELIVDRGVLVPGAGRGQFLRPA